MRCYVAMLHQDGEAGFRFTFPDFPCSASQAAGFQEIRGVAEEALKGHIMALMEEGQPIPTPYPIEKLVGDKTYATAVPFLVCLPLDFFTVDHDMHPGHIGSAN